MKFAEAGKRGLVTYVQKVLEETARYKPETYEIIDNGGSSHYKAFLISVANASQYGNNALHSPTGLDERRSAERHNHGATSML